MLRRRARATSLLALGATLTALALVSPTTGAGAVPAPNTTERVSVDHTGGDANGWSNQPVISADGNVVMFSSTASDIVDGPGSVAYVRNLTTGVTTPVPGGPDLSHARLTGDGGRLVFDSARTDLVPGDTNGKRDVFVHDFAAGTTTRVSVDSNGAQYPAGNSTSAGISDDGRYVAFVTGTVQTANCQNDRVSVRDLTIGTTRIVRRCVVDATISGDGSALVTMSSATENCGYQLGQVELSTLASTPAGCGTEPAISGNGDVVAFKAHGGGGLVGMQAFDVRSATHERIDVSDAGTPSDGALGLVNSGPVLNGTGQVVAFAANATNLVPGDGSTADVFVRDRIAGSTRMVSVATDGTPGEQESVQPAISADGLVVAFSSRSRDLVAAPDGNDQIDVFVRQIVPSACATATPTRTGTPGNDVLTGTTGHDVILGLGGDDTIRGNGGNDLICGGPGSDTASFAGSAAPIDADLAAGTATGQGSDTLRGIENLEGSAYADRLRGDAGPNRLVGLGGADALTGMGGDDRLEGGAANDKLYGYAGRDTLLGGTGNDLLSGGADIDALDGGDGTDTCGGDTSDTPVTSCE